MYVYIYKFIFRLATGIRIKLFGSRYIYTFVHVKYMHMRWAGYIRNRSGYRYRTRYNYDHDKLNIYIYYVYIYIYI